MLVFRKDPSSACFGRSKESLRQMRLSSAESLELEWRCGLCRAQAIRRRGRPISTGRSRPRLQRLMDFRPASFFSDE